LKKVRNKNKANEVASSVKIVEVSPLSARQEIIVIFFVICLIIYLVGLRFHYLNKAQQKNLGIRSYQTKALFLKNQAPIMYSSLNSAAGDIIDMYQESGKWPEIQTLVREAIPPFARQFLPVGLRGYEWRKFQGNGWVDYLGTNKHVGQEMQDVNDPLPDSFILRIIDLKRTHNLYPYIMPDKTGNVCFTWQVWHYPGRRDYPGKDHLIDRGWKWIVNADDRGRIIEKQTK